MTTPEPPTSRDRGGPRLVGAALAVLDAAAAVLEDAEARILVEDARRLRGDLAALLGRALDEGAAPDVACALAALSLDLDDLTAHLEDQCPSP